MLHTCSLLKIDNALAEGSKYGTLWAREELILALYLYCQIPFARTKANNPEVIRLAHFLERTPSSVARKLGNFGAFDPLLAQKGITGLTHHSKMDKTIWEEFDQNWDQLIEKSRHLLTEQYEESTLPSEKRNSSVISQPSGATEQPRVVKTRLRQAFFRRAILSSYLDSCCVCGIDLTQLLIASHIIPWSANQKTRVDPRNGLCLCALHDKAFDRGLISVKPTHEIAVSHSVNNSYAPFTDTALAAFQEQKIRLPERFSPNPEYLQWHFENVFQN